MSKKPTMTQGEMKAAIKVGPRFGQVSTPAHWAPHLTADELRGALKLAHEQAMDGLGESPAHWMGLTEKEFSEWMRSETVPRRLSRKCRKP